MQVDSRGSHFDDRAPGENFTLESYIEFLAPTTGKYFVGVSGSENTTYNAVTGQGDSTGSKGNYLLTLTISAKPPNLDPDDQISEAVALGTTTVNGAIGSQGDVDMFTFSLTKPEGVVFELKNLSVFGVFRLFDAAGNELDIFQNFDLGDVFFSHAFDAAGKYYLGVSGSFNDIYSPTTGLGDRGSETGSYSLTLRRDTDDQLSEKRFVTNGTELDDAISNTFDVDMYAISGIAGEEWTFNVTTPTSTFAPFLTLFDSNGVRLKSDGPDGAVRARFQSTGVIYFGVSSGNNGDYDPVTGGNDFEGGLGTYHVSVRKVTADPDDQISEARPLVLGVGRSDTIGTRPSDVDMYSFQATAGKPLAIDLDRPAGGLADGWLIVYDSAGNEVDFSVDPSAPGELVENEAYIELLPTKTGTYYVGVSSSENFFYNPVTGNFDVDRGTGGAYTITLSSIFDADDQLTEAIAVAVGASRTDSIGITSDVDMIKFTVTSAGQRIAIDLDRPAGSSLDSQLRLFNAAGNQLASNDDAPAPGEAIGGDSYLEFVFSQAGTYYVGVSASDNAFYDPLTGLGKQTGNSIGGYTLRINRLA